MFYTDDKKAQYKTMFCKCGCGNGVILKVDEDECGLSLQLVSDNFYSGQKSFKDKLRRIWCIIRGKEYRYFDLHIDDDEVTEFKEFVAKL